MLETCLRLSCLLNDLSADRLTAAGAEAELQSEGLAHHVHDPHEVVGLGEPDPIVSVPVRRALARISHRRTGDEPDRWAALYPRPGRLAGLRGPADLVAEALEVGAVVMCHTGASAGLAWTGVRVGAGVQWRLWQATPPLPPATVAEARLNLTQEMARATARLSGLEPPEGRRPRTTAPRLSRGASRADQALADLAWTVLVAADTGLAEADRVLTSHAATTRESALLPLVGAALEALTAASAWPAA